MKAISTLAGALWLAGCATIGGGDATTQAPEAPKAPGDTIRFAAGPCFGLCPRYSVTVTPDGSAVLEPQRNIAVPGPTRFTVTQAQYRKLRDGFAPFRPPTGTNKRIGHGENCQRAATDMPGYAITWTRKGMADTELDFYSGCFDARYAKLRAAIAGVPRVLQIEAMLKARASG